MKKRPVTKAAVIGTALEFYDHALFGLGAAIVFDKQFFPAETPSRAPWAPSPLSPSDSWPARSAVSCSATSATVPGASRCWS
ncbi:hypothetical protein ACFQ0B_40935 [Nonomuraea thailandensis]